MSKQKPASGADFEQRIEGRIDEALSFPLLTEGVSFPQTQTPSAPAASGQASLDQIVQGAIRQVLGWRPKPNDPGGFTAALNQSFACDEVEGHTVCKWTPRSYAVQAQADMGALTGAQASLYSRAKAALEQALPLLDGLTFLRVDADPQDCEAVRALIRDELTEVVNEIGVLGGPRVQRVDGYFRLLAEYDPTQASRKLVDPEKVKGHLGELRERFGLTLDRVNTIDEEQDVTNYFVFADQVSALVEGWHSYRGYFDRKGRDVFLGTQVFLLSEDLAVLAEAVQETYFAMDSVFLGPAERQATSLKLDNVAPMTISEMLDWVGNFAELEGRRIIQEGGKDGITQSFTPTVRKLHDLVNEAARISKSGSSNPTPKFHHPRVALALANLAIQLEKAYKDANQLRRQPKPSIEMVWPETASVGEKPRVTIVGANFQQGATASLNKSGASREAIPGEKVSVLSENEIMADFDLTGRDPDTLWTVVVKNPDDQYATLPKKFVIKPQASPGTNPLMVLRVDRVEFGRSKSVISRQAAATGKPGETLDLEIRGLGFPKNFECQFGRGKSILVNQAAYINENQLLVNITIDGNARSGLKPVTVINLDDRSQKDTKHDGFEIK